MFLVENEQLGLRRISLEDVSERYLNWLKDDEVILGLEHKNKNISIEDLKDFVRTVNSNNANLFLAIIDKKNNKHIGNIKLSEISTVNKNANLGILIGDKNYWGKGVGYNACKLLIDYSFSKLGLQKIWLAVFSNNENAIKLYLKLGFIVEGRLSKHVNVNEIFYDKILMSLFKN